MLPSFVLLLLADNSKQFLIVISLPSLTPCSDQMRHHRCYPAPGVQVSAPPGPPRGVRRAAPARPRSLSPPVRPPVVARAATCDARAPPLYSNRHVCPAAIREKGYSCEPGRTCPSEAIVSVCASVHCWRQRRRSGVLSVGGGSRGPGKVPRGPVIAPARPVASRGR